MVLLSALPMLADGKKPTAALPTEPAPAASPQGAQAIAAGESEAKTQAESNLNAKGGAAFAQAAAAGFTKQSGAKIKACRDSTRDAAPFTVYAMLNRRGSVKHSLAVPAASAAGACLLPSVKSHAFPEPPGPNWWVRIDSEAPEIHDPEK